MVVINQVKDACVEFGGAAIQPDKSGRYDIVILSASGVVRIMGVFDNKERAEGVLKEIIARATSDDRNYYYIPKE